MSITHSAGQDLRRQQGKKTAAAHQLLHWRNDQNQSKGAVEAMPA